MPQPSAPHDGSCVSLSVQHKSPLAEELEERLLAARAARAAAARERASADDADEEPPAAAGVAAAMGVISRGGAVSGAHPQPLQCCIAHALF